MLLVANWDGYTGEIVVDKTAEQHQSPQLCVPERSLTQFLSPQLKAPSCFVTAPDIFLEIKSLSVLEFQTTDQTLLFEFFSANLKVRRSKSMSVIGASPEMTLILVKTETLENKHVSNNILLTESHSVCSLSEETKWALADLFLIPVCLKGAQDVPEVSDCVRSETAAPLLHQMFDCFPGNSILQDLLPRSENDCCNWKINISFGQIPKHIQLKTDSQHVEKQTLQMAIDVSRAFSFWGESPYDKLGQGCCSVNCRAKAIDFWCSIPVSAE
ncbi:uncharacterized protein V6R79_005885 [Siganus canaliculatus]